MNPKILIVIGIVLLIIGSAGLVFSIGQTGDVVRSIPDPENDALETLTFGGPGSKNVTLERGEYEVWIEEGDEVDTLEVTDEEGNSVFERDEGETITIDEPGSGERAYEKVGDLDINEGGSYTFQTNEGCTLYVPESHPFFDTFTSILNWIVVLIVSGYSIFIGVGLLVLSWFIKKDCPYCGKTISEDSLRCKYCNQDLTQRTGGYDSQTRNRYQQNPPPPPPPPPEEARPGQKENGESGEK